MLAVTVLAHAQLFIREGLTERLGLDQLATAALRIAGLCGYGTMTGRFWSCIREEKYARKEKMESLREC